MTNKSNTSKNFFESLVDAQKQAVETMVETTKKFSNGNAIVNDTIEKGADYFKKAVDASKETFEKVSGTANTMKEEVKNSSNQMNDFFTNWANQQKAWATQMQEMNKSFMNNMSNPTNFQNPMQNMQTMWNNMNAQNNMNQMMNQFTPANMQEQMEKGAEQMKSFWNQFQTILNTNYSDVKKNFENGTLQDSFKGMFNMSEGFSTFYELWMPMMKSMNEKTFNLDVFKNNIDMNKYKEFMDKTFSFMPTGTQEYFSGMQNTFSDMMKNNSANMTGMFNNMKGGMENLMPGMFGNPFSNMLNNYNNAYGQMMSASSSPFAKLMTPNSDTKTIQEWNAILNNVNIYNIKNAELQFMTYTTGNKVMEKIAASVMHKIENGEEVTSIMKLYQEWLNASDAQFVELFETDEYSKLMAEVSALQMGIKKDFERQQEKMFANIPVATRSEMDEVYQAMYDLKKQVRQLQSMLDLDVNAVTNTEVKHEEPKATVTPKATVAPKATAAKAPVKKTANKK
jgi:hypothetical protein